MNVKKFLLLSATLALTSTSFAKEKAKSAELSKDERNQMAEMHSKMADCLKSDKVMSECHSEMMKSCKEMGNKCEMQMKRHAKMHQRPAKQTTSNEDQTQSVSSSMSSTTTTDQNADYAKKEKKAKSKKHKSKSKGTSSSSGSESEGHDQTHAVGEEGQTQM